MKRMKKLLAIMLSCMLLASAIPAGAEETLPQPVATEGIIPEPTAEAGAAATAEEGPVPLTNEDFVIEDGVLVKYTGSASSVTIPDGVKKIGDGAFKGCRRLETVKLPEGLEEIGQDAFASCENLASIPLPSSLKHIGTGAFSECSGLKRVNLPDGLNSFGQSAFYGTGLTEITIPGGIRAIPVSTFERCEDLKKVVIESDELTTIDVWAFSNCTSLKQINLPSSLKNIEGGAFAYCGALKSIELPDGLTSLSGFGSTGLTEITIPGSVKYADGFSECLQLEKVIIRDGVTGISSYAFSGCEELRMVVIESDDLASVGEQAFFGCRRLTEITLPKSVEQIGADVFKACGDLTVWVHKDSKAHEYCKENYEAQGFIYKLTGGETEDAEPIGIRPACADFAVNGKASGDTLTIRLGDAMRLSGAVTDTDGDLRSVTVTVQDVDDRAKSATLYRAENLPSLSGYSLNDVSAKASDALGMKPGHTYEIVLWAEDEAGNGLYGGNPEENWDEYVWKVTVTVQEGDSSQPAEKYEVRTNSIRLDNRTSGTGYVVLKEGSVMQEDRYAFIQWSWVNKAGDSIVADSCVKLRKLEDGKYSFDAKSVFISGATLQNMIMIVTDDPNAADFSCRNLGAGVLNK